MKPLKGYIIWTLHKLSPVFQLFYFFYLTSGCFIINFETYLILEECYSTRYRRYSCLFLFISGALSFFSCSLSDPGRITHTSLEKHLQYYSYDEIIFHQNSQCKTCRMLKPARSKHCKYCMSCISRYDHHCFLLNNCVGGYNNIYFFVFIHVNILITLYSSYITSLCIYSIIKYKKLLQATFIHKESNTILPDSYITISWYLFSKYSPTFSLLLVSLFSLISLVLLLIREMYFSFCFNITNNEKTKYRKLKERYPYVNFNFYNKGFLKNVKDALFYKKNVEEFFKKKT
ncbi:palmitoyltransferase DHHC12, putative [Plasmodium ovale]|uniref:Palmitoyltransferase n=1 Tax=Plasmodium ovale TaxID=36330 RepID=A0A1D3RDF3_PLAOA|nr:palmitoyltransferase DHHC12, putative [Plasmodium ovale]